MKQRLRGAVVQIVGVTIAVGLLYLALRNVDFSGMWAALETANYWWLIPLFAATLAGHLLRAIRWQMLLDALPESESSGDGPGVTLGAAFSSVMIGYLLNLVIPRIGEIARTANLATRTGLRFSSVFGTVVIERLLDFVILLVILAGVGFVLVGSPAAESLLFEPMRERFATLTGQHLLAAIIVLAIAVALFLWLWRTLKQRESNQGGLSAKILPVMRSFRLGFVSLFTSPHRIGIATTTVAIWLSYWLLLYVSLYMLNMVGPFDLGAITAFVLLGIGTIGFVLPAPGGIGSYHYFIIETFVKVYDVPYDVSAGFAVLTHTAQIIFLTVVGFGCLIAQGSSFTSVLSAARKAEGDSDGGPIFDGGTD
jgi:uncharacterized protein (TIRG00374 family)